MLISQPFMNRFGSYLDQNGGEKGSYVPRMNLEGYGVGVINYRGIYYDAGEFRMTSYWKILYKVTIVLLVMARTTKLLVMYKT